MAARLVGFVAIHYECVFAPNLSCHSTATRICLCSHVVVVGSALLPGATVNVGIHPSNVVITKLKMDKDRKNLIARKKSEAKKYTDADAANAVE